MKEVNHLLQEAELDFLTPASGFDFKIWFSEMF